MTPRRAGDTLGPWWGGPRRIGSLLVGASVLLGALLLTTTSITADSAAPVVVAALNGEVDPVTAGYLHRVVKVAEADDATLLVVTIDTPVIGNRERDNRHGLILPLAIDLRTHQTVATWNPSCGEDGPHGLRLDEKAGFLFVACSAKAEVLDVGHAGAILSSPVVDRGILYLASMDGTLYALQ